MYISYYYAGWFMMYASYLYFNQSQTPGEVRFSRLYNIWIFLYFYILIIINDYITITITQYYTCIYKCI